jgi:TetR/AcrR family fatty acid metabolism transcriptional regulator
MPTKREKLQEREEAILKAAATVFLTGGLKTARMAEIAKAAKVAEGTLYLYYRNKEALFAAVVAAHWQDLTAGAQRAVAGVDEPNEQLEALATYTLLRIVKDWKLFELTFLVTYAGDQQDQDLTDRQGYVQVFDEIIRRGIDRGDFTPDADARTLRDLFFGTIDYTARSALSRGHKKPPEAAIPLLLKAMAGVLGTPTNNHPQPSISRLERAIERLEAMTEERRQP